MRGLWVKGEREGEKNSSTSSLKKEKKSSLPPLFLGSHCCWQELARPYSHNGHHVCLSLPPTHTHTHTAITTRVCTERTHAGLAVLYLPKQINLRRLSHSGAAAPVHAPAYTHTHTNTHAHTHTLSSMYYYYLHACLPSPFVTPFVGATRCCQYSYRCALVCGCVRAFAPVSARVCVFHCVPDIAVIYAPYFYLLSLHYGRLHYFRESYFPSATRQRQVRPLPSSRQLPYPLR